ncbi:hypothetical protein BHE74_00039153 [Ensete ventricosum]|nr:hypothetical protein BHE74_00039153 [Ensete ventricosum]
MQGNRGRATHGGTRFLPLLLSLSLGEYRSKSTANGRFLRYHPVVGDPRTDQLADRYISFDTRPYRAPIVLLVNVPLRRESSDLPSELRGELGSVEPVYVPDPALPVQQLLVVRIHVVAEHRDEPHHGGGHPLLGIRLATGRGRGDGGADGAEVAAPAEGEAAACGRLRASTVGMRRVCIPARGLTLEEGRESAGRTEVGERAQ